MESVHHVTTSSKILFSKVRKIVPPMLESFHKGLFTTTTDFRSTVVDNCFQSQNLLLTFMTGQLGRVAVIGGCAE